jgi:hypothetical protein
MNWTDGMSTVSNLTRNDLKEPEHPELATDVHLRVIPLRSAQQIRAY